MATFAIEGDYSAYLDTVGRWYRTQFGKVIAEEVMTNARKHEYEVKNFVEWLQSAGITWDIYNDKQKAFEGHSAKGLMITETAMRLAYAVRTMVEQGAEVQLSGRDYLMHSSNDALVRDVLMQQLHLAQEEVDMAPAGLTIKGDLFHEGDYPELNRLLTEAVRAENHAVTMPGKAAV